MKTTKIKNFHRFRNLKRISKKSQIQMMETVFILFIFFILLVIGFVFYGKFFTGGVKTEKTAISQLNTVQIAQRVADLPEIQCTKKNVKIDNCVDLYKLKTAETLIKDENSIHYFDMLGYSTITIKQIHPSPPAGSPWIIYDKSLPSRQKTSVIQIPTIIYNPTDNGYCYVGPGSCAFGMIEVKVYS